MNFMLFLSALVAGIYLSGCGEKMSTDDLVSSCAEGCSSAGSTSQFPEVPVTSTSSGTPSELGTTEAQYLPWYCAHKQTLLAGFVDLSRLNQSVDATVVPAMYLDFNRSGAINTTDMLMIFNYASISQERKDAVKAGLLNYVRAHQSIDAALAPHADVNGSGTITALDIGLTYNTLTHCFGEQFPIQPPAEGLPSYCAGSEEMLQNFANFMWENRNVDASTAPLSSLDLDHNGSLSPAEMNQIAYFRTQWAEGREIVKAALMDLVRLQQGSSSTNSNGIAWLSVADVNGSGYVSSSDTTLVRIRLENCF